MIDPFLLTGVAGMCLVLSTFLLNQLKILKQESLAYDVCNAVGGVLLVVYAWSGSAWPFVILNGVWAAYSLKDVVADLRKSEA